MSKRGGIFLFSALFVLLIASTASAATLFSEDFGFGIDWTTALPAGWTASDDATSGMDDQQSISGGSDGNRYAWIQGDTGDQDITRASISTAGFQNIQIKYSYNLIGSFASADFLVVEWKKSTDVAFITIQKVTGIPGWNTVLFNLPSAAANTNIDVRFRAEATETSDFVFIDNINISGTSIENCGNGVLNNGEHCDDGNLNNNDGCSSTCLLTFCGDGTLQQPNGVGTAGINDDGVESCDDGNLNNNDNCNNNCISTITEGFCSDGIVQDDEQCDDSNTANGDGCSSTCQVELPECGNNIIESSEECDDGNQNNFDACKNDCTDNVCTDGFIGGPGEQCDDGNLDNNDACKNDCTNNVCGDFVIFTGVEECDDGNLFDGDGCDSNCQLEGPICGDGNLDFGEECDDGNFNNHDDCLNTCQDPSCGDGFFWIGHEQCDDGNNENGDGCNATCNFEGGGKCFAPVDVMLVIDRSGSMSTLDDGVTRLQNAKTAAIAFLGQVNFSKDTVGLTSFNETATLDQSLTNIQGTITTKINVLKAGGQTNIGDGFRVAREDLLLNADDTKAMVFLSDGAPNAIKLSNGSVRFCTAVPTTPNNCTRHALNESNVTKLAGIEVFVIGLGVNNFTESLLKEMATSPAHYFSAANSTVLESIYLQIAQEICPCQGFDCGINTDQCNVGECNIETDQCEFNQQPLSTSCEEDGTECTTQHCDGQGACVVNDTVDVPAAEQCQSFYCDPADGEIKTNVSGFPLSKPCDTDQDACTTQHCNGQGQCIVNATTPVPSPEQCRSFFCDPADGQIKQDVSGFPLSTPCEADGNLCTVDHCNGNGNCTKQRDKDCSAFDGQCQQGNCNPQTGNCFADFSSFPISTTCEADGNLCTLDHCNGAGTCLNFGNVFVPPPEQCQSFFCDPQTGNIGFNPFDLSTFCSTDYDPCTIQHCNGNGQCVINPQAELPPECFGGDAKVSQNQPAINFGNGIYMIVNPKQGAIDRSYIRIDASSLNSFVNTSTLNLTVYQTGGSATGTQIDAFYCRDHDFIETTINWQNQPLNGSCSLADSITVPNDVVAGIPESHHIFNLTNETNFEINNTLDQLFTIVLKSPLENTGVPTNNLHVQYLTSEYSEATYRPKIRFS